MLDKFRSAFDSYWSDPNQGFEQYDPVQFPEHEERLKAALSRAGGGSAGTSTEEFGFDLRPFRFQQEILDALERERVVYGRNRSLVIAATGTGKTLIAAFDYRRLCAQSRERGESRRPRLLFIAHRAEILKQARNAYRHVLRDGNFGELLVDGHRPERGDHVFASVQSLTAGDRLELMDPGYFDVVVIDEFHHAAASAWTRVLQMLRPKLLLGLTATPERGDGQDITKWFDHHVAAELRLWEALDRGLLCPFHYFALGNESLDFRGIDWTSGHYETSQVEALLTGNDIVMRWVMTELESKVASPQRMRALVFTASVKHANYVADFLNAHGVAALALTGESVSQTREEGRRRLTDGTLQAIVTVDLFNEGIDIPEIDTVIMLRPTESATVFLQQLGRGLRKAEDKAVLTVLDFVGHHRKEFRFDLRLRAMTGIGRSDIRDAIANGFPYLPAGAQVQLDEVASRLVLENVKNALPTSWRAIAHDVRSHANGRSAIEYKLRDYLQDSALDLQSIYGRKDSSWLWLQARAGLSGASEVADGSPTFQVRKLLHVDDAPRLAAYRRLLLEPDFNRRIQSVSLLDQRFANMLYLSVFGSRQHDSLEQGLLALCADEQFVAEAMQAFEIAEHEIPYSTTPLSSEFPHSPLSVHARYSRAEMLAALGAASFERSPKGQIAGVRFVDDLKADVFDMTWTKSDREYSPHTMYRDFAISDRLIHWESQNADHQASGKIQRYIRHVELGSRVMLFARETKQYEYGTRPYLFLGEAEYTSHEGNRPVSFVWRLKHPMPADFLGRSQLLAG